MHACDGIYWRRQQHCRSARRRCPPQQQPVTLNVVTGRRPEHGRLRQGLSRSDVREGASRRHRQGGRHGPGRCRLAEDLREAPSRERQRRAGTSTSPSSIRRRPATWSKGSSWRAYAKDVADDKLVTSPRPRTRARHQCRAAMSSRCSTARPRSPTTRPWCQDPPASYAELEKWVEANPNKFGYNGIKGGMSGVSFVVGWIYANAPDADRLMYGPYDPRRKELGRSVRASSRPSTAMSVLTPGNAGTLDMLNRGEIVDGAGLGRHVLYLALPTAKFRRP